MAHEYKHNNHALIIHYPITAGMYKKIVHGLATRNPATYVYAIQIHTKFKTVVMPIGKIYLIILIPILIYVSSSISGLCNI